MFFEKKPFFFLFTAPIDNPLTQKENICREILDEIVIDVFKTISIKNSEPKLNHMKKDLMLTIRLLLDIDKSTKYAAQKLKKQNQEKLLNAMENEPVI